MSTLITIVHVLVCLFLMLTVLLQSGKSGMGGAFGGGNTQTVFGGGGASSFLRRLTAGAGTLFMITSMVLAFIASRNAGDYFDSFISKEEGRAGEKQRAIDAALTGTTTKSILPTLPGKNTGSATTSPLESPAPEMVTPPAGSATAPAGSATAPTPAGSATTGSATTPEVKDVTPPGEKKPTDKPAPAQSSPNAPKP